MARLRRSDPAQPGLRRVRHGRGFSYVVKEVAEALGNTPAVCRASYIDGRVIDRYHHGETIAPKLDAPHGNHKAAEQAVLKLLRG